MEIIKINIHLKIEKLHEKTITASLFISSDRGAMAVFCYKM